MDIWDGRSARGRREFAEYMLLVLNPMDLRHKSVESYKVAMGMAAGIPARIPGARMAAPVEIREKAIQEFQSTFRDLIDQWIESAKQDGVEQPWQRSIEYTSAEFPETIEQKLNAFWKRHPPVVLFNGNEQVISTQTMLRQADWFHLSGESTGRVLEQARDHAIAQFALLMDSPSRLRIFRCDECGSYFTKVRMPKRGAAIKRGSYCEQCDGEASKRRVKDARRGRLVQMIGWAADAMERCKPENRFGKRIDWIVEKVNASLRAEGRETIRSNWVTWHLQEIEAEVERRKHAKG